MGDVISGIEGLRPDSPVTRDAVIWCYRALLDREPENEGAVQGHLKRDNFIQLLKAFVASEEFRRRYGGGAKLSRIFHPLLLPPARIDVNIPEERLEEAIARIREEWTFLGIDRPFHSVLTNPIFLPENIETSLPEFWASGEAEAARVRGMFESHGMQTSDKVCVEYGCGVGRVTRALARAFGKVVAYDISIPHMDIAREKLMSEGVGNVEIRSRVDSPLSPLETCDAFYSTIVFQHNPPPVIRALVRLALQALRPGGIAIFQLPVYCVGYSFDFDKWISTKTRLDMEMHCLPQRYVFEVAEEVRCIPLDVREDFSTNSNSFISNTFIFRKQAPTDEGNV